jgi:dTDP-4-amino-4,6-dideoxygalactose transaminase
MKSMLRRTFVGAGAAIALQAAPGRKTTDKPAVLGGDPVRTKAYPQWPQVTKSDESNWLDALRACKWWRAQGHYVVDFEQAWAERMGAKHCIATCNGTSALMAALNALEVGPKDEVIVTPFTFIATVNAILGMYALPVFVDTDLATHLIDPDKIEAAITPRTRCIMPVHIAGNVANMDKIMEISRRRGVPVVEDACQAHLAEWRGKPASTLGDLGCFSFQKYKNVPGGEAGGVITNDDKLFRHAYGFHSHYRNPPNESSIDKDGRNGINLRMAEFQAALLLAQMTRMEENARRRETNGKYLTELLVEIPGITPATSYDGCTRNAYHMYMLRYDPSGFEGLSKGQFLKAVNAEGIPISDDVQHLNRDPFLENTVQTRMFRAVYSEKDLAGWRERLPCPVNDRLCEQAMHMSQPMVLGSKSDMEDIAIAMQKVQKNAGAIKNS